MINPKFTKGPWQLVTGKTYCAVRVESKVVADLRVVNGCFSTHDAHLIAAAPDMYAMLEQLCNDADMLPIECPAYNYIRELLAKARGEQ